MLIIFFILGLIIGSFLNVVVYRLRVAESLLGRSHCPHCNNIIHWYDNIPLISFIVLQFRCRDCRQKISFQYPLVELSAGILFTAIGAKFFIIDDLASWVVTGYYLGLVSMLIAILVYDFLYLEIPSLVLWPAIFWTIAFNLYFDWQSAFPNINNARLEFFTPLNLATYSGTLAAIVAFLFFFILVAISREKWMGMGDALLAILIGLLLGWPEIILALFLAFTIGAIYGIILLGLRKKKLKSQLPFAPFMIIGAMIALFYGQALISWYLSWLNFR
jgi:prepilin signal peptidase PulO-like enzyme (type II secretory pathway)